MKKVLIFILVLLIVPLPVFADIVTTQSMIYLDAPYLLILIILVETVALWLIVKSNKISFSRSLLAITIANIVTAIVGIMVPLGKGQMMAYTILIVGYPLSSLIEAPIIKQLIKNETYTMKDIFRLSFYVNLASYLPIAIWLFFTLEPYTIPDVTS